MGDFALIADEHEGRNLKLKNIGTGNTLNTFTQSELSDLQSSKSWTYPVKIKFNGPFIIITDFTNTQIIYKHCTLQTSGVAGIALSDSHSLSDFFISDEFLVQFTLEVPEDIVSSLETMAVTDLSINAEYFSFGWGAITGNAIYVTFDGYTHTVTDSEFKIISKGVIGYAVRIDARTLQTWAANSKKGY